MPQCLKLGGGLRRAQDATRTDLALAVVTS